MGLFWRQIALAGFYSIYGRTDRSRWLPTREICEAGSTMSGPTHGDGLDLSALYRFLDDFERDTPMSVSQRVALARALRPLLLREGKRRQSISGTAPGRRRIVRKSDAKSFRARDVIAKCVQLAPATLRKAEAIIDASERDPSLGWFVKNLDEMVGLLRARKLIGICFQRVFQDRERPAIRVPKAYDAAFGVALLRKFNERFGSRNGKLPNVHQSVDCGGTGFGGSQKSFGSFLEG